MIEELKKARALLVKGWTKGSFAKNAQGEKCVPYSDKAVCWCAGGALKVVTDNWSDLWDVVEAELKGGYLPDFNDAQETVEPVLALFDKAIAKLEAAQ